MVQIKLALSNLRYILTQSDLLAIRFALDFGSLMWAFWIVTTLAIFPNAIDDYSTLIYASINLPVWAILFAIHGTVGVIALLLKQRNKFWIMVGSGFGALLWTASLNIILLTRIAEHSLPMGGAHWMASFIAWWIFLRDCYGHYQDE